MKHGYSYRNPKSKARLLRRRWEASIAAWFHAMDESMSVLEEATNRAYGQFFYPVELNPDRRAVTIPRQ